LLKAIYSVDGEPLLASKLNRAHSLNAPKSSGLHGSVLDREE